MIVGFKHRGVKRFFETGDARGLNPNHVPKVRRILARLQAASSVRDLDAPGLRLHPLKAAGKDSGPSMWIVTGEPPSGSTVEIVTR